MKKEPPLYRPPKVRPKNLTIGRSVHMRFLFIMLLTHISNRDILPVSRCDISKLDIGGANGFKIKEGLRPNVRDSLLHTVLPAGASARIRYRARGKRDDER